MIVETINDNSTIRTSLTINKRDWYVDNDFTKHTTQEDEAVWKQHSTDKFFMEYESTDDIIKIKEVFKVKVKQDYWI